METYKHIFRDKQTRLELAPEFVSHSLNEAISNYWQEEDSWKEYLTTELTVNGVVKYIDIKDAIQSRDWAEMSDGERAWEIAASRGDDMRKGAL